MESFLNPVTNQPLNILSYWCTVPYISSTVPGHRNLYARSVRSVLVRTRDPPRTKLYRTSQTRAGRGGMMRDRVFSFALFCFICLFFLNNFG